MTVWFGKAERLDTLAHMPALQASLGPHHHPPPFRHCRRLGSNLSSICKKVLRLQPFLPTTQPPENLSLFWKVLYYSGALFSPNCVLALGFNPGEGLGRTCCVWGAWPAVGRACCFPGMS